MNKKHSFQYKLITGFFVFSMLSGLFFSLTQFNPKSWLFWFYVIWTVFYGGLLYCWIDEKRYEKFERVLTPLIYGAFILFFAILAIGCLLYNLNIYINEQGSVINLLGGIIGTISCGAAGLFTVAYLRGSLKSNRK